jgi:hypothetical protein
VSASKRGGGACTEPAEGINAKRFAHEGMAGPASS